MNPYFDFKDGSINASTWFWDFGDGTTSDLQDPSHNYSDPGYYATSLIVTSSEGCVAEISREIFVENVVSFYVPNAFTPNGDGKNDNFLVTGHAISGYEMQIYNRWGQEVFHSSGPYDSWNGNDSKGSPVQEGVYTYRLKIYNDPGNTARNGTVTLVR